MRLRAAVWIALLGASGIVMANPEFTIGRSGQVQYGAYDFKTSHVSVGTESKFIQSEQFDESWGHGQLDFAQGAMAWGSHACSGPKHPGEFGQAYGYGTSQVDTTYVVQSDTLAVGTQVSVVLDLNFSWSGDVDYSGHYNAQVQNDVVLNVATSSNANAVREESRYTEVGKTQGNEEHRTGWFASPSSTHSYVFSTRVGQAIGFSLFGASHSDTTAYLPDANYADTEAAITWGLSGQGTSLRFYNPSGFAPNVPGASGPWVPHNPAATPEPATFALIGLGALVARRRKRS